MCGIAGIFGHVADSSSLATRVQWMQDAQRFRGPDGEGVWIDEALGCALGVRRLALVDIKGGHQPYVNEDGALSMVFNGEIYNHRELRNELEKSGHQFRGGADGEPAIHLYEDLGDNFVTRLRGMFAIALVDTRRRKIILSRDSPGMKPLYWAHTPDGLVFASTAASIFASRLLFPKPSASGLSAFFRYGYIPAPLTAFEGVHRLEAGCSLSLELGQSPAIQRFAAPRFTADQDFANEADAVEHLEMKLRTAVASHLQGETDVCAYLSGGIDSSLVASLASEHGPLNTYSLTFPANPNLDESIHARRVARRIGSTHIEIPVKSQTLLDQLPAVARAIEEPCALPGHLHLLLARTAGITHRCALTGEGADELFAGYPWLAEPAGLAARTWFPPPIARFLISVLPPLREELFWRQLAAATEEDALAESLGPFPAHELSQLHPSLGRPPPGASVIPRATRDSATDLFQRRLGFELTHRLPEGLLFMVDKASMYCGLEVRVPFLAHDVMSFALSLPNHWKQRDGREKYLLNRLAERRVPEISMRKKQGLRIPHNAALFHPEAHARIREMLLDSRAPGFHFDALSVERFLDREFAGKEHGKPQRGWLIWRLLLTQTWADAWL
jgi:asparagine synthase (glutamine-hydrolysing)